jgi:putative transcriptional regulator
MSVKVTTRISAGSDSSSPLSDAEKVRLDALTDDDIVRAAAEDPDNPILTQADLAEFRPVSNARRIRRALNMTQEAFAEAFHIPIGTLRDWEQHRTEPDQAARSYLKVISAAPEVVRNVLSERK